MATKTTVFKCTQCKGTLKRIEKNIFQCLYCDSINLIDIEDDRNHSISNVVRQALHEISYRRMNNALENIADCEKIDRNFIGTLVARIAYETINLAVSGCCDKRTYGFNMSQLQKDYRLLKDTDSSVGEDEAVLYSLLDEPDIYATLVLVYDSLGDNTRRDHVMSLLNVKEIDSSAANNDLLLFAVRNKKFGIADNILSHSGFYDDDCALDTVLSEYPDGDSKRIIVKNLFSSGTFRKNTSAAVGKYLADAKDSNETKASVASAAIHSGVKLSVGSLIENVLKDAETKEVDSVASELCCLKPSDDDVLKLLDFGLSSGSADKALSVLECIKKSGKYLSVPSKYLLLVLNSDKYNAEEKIRVLEKCFDFTVGIKEFNSAVENYLCRNSSPADERIPVIEFLLSKTDSLPTDTVKNYVLKTAADGEKKPDVVSAIFDMNLNMSFFNNLLSDYIKSNTDSAVVKEHIIRILSDKNLKIGHVSFADYISSSSADAAEMKTGIQSMIRNGAKPEASAANTYIEKNSPEDFSQELFSVLLVPGSVFTENSIKKYLLEIGDRGNRKYENIRRISEYSSVDFSSIVCNITHLGRDIECNILQAYVLSSCDYYQTSADIVTFLCRSQRVNINSKISVSGKSVRLKKYLKENRSGLSTVADKIFTECGI